MTRSADNRIDLENAQLMTEVQQRRRWTFIQKLRVAQEASAPGTSVSSIARKYGMAPSQLFRWRKILLEGSQVHVSTVDRTSDQGELRELNRRVRELERLLGKATLENEILRETVAMQKRESGDGKVPSTFPDYHR
jgi:transposase